VNPAIIGERVFNIGRENESRVESYYPAAVDKQKWYQAQEIRKNRPKGTTGGYIYPVNIFSGLSFCGYCGSRCGVQNFNTGRRSALRCSAYAKKEVSTDICAGGSSPARFLEQVIIEFCSDQINFDAIFKQEIADISSLRVQYATLEQQILKLSNKLTKVEDLYLEDEISKGRYIERKNEFENTLKVDKAQLDLLKVEIEANTHVKTTNEAEFAKLLALLKGNEIPNELRLKIRDLLPKFIDKITVFRYGDWLSPQKLQQAKDLLGQKNNNDIIKFMEQRAIKSRAMIIYGLHFKNGYFRAIWFDAKKQTWFSKTDNTGLLHEENIAVTGGILNDNKAKVS